MNTERPTELQLELEAVRLRMKASSSGPERVLAAEIDRLTEENAELRERIEKHGKYEPNPQIMQRRTSSKCAPNAVRNSKSSFKANATMGRVTEQLETARKDCGALVDLVARLTIRSERLRDLVTKLDSVHADS